jgi:hypothetical protein
VKVESPAGQVTRCGGTKELNAEGGPAVAILATDSAATIKTAHKT